MCAVPKTAGTRSTSTTSKSESNSSAGKYICIILPLLLKYPANQPILIEFP